MIEEFLASIEQLKVLGWKEARPWHEFFATFKPVELNHHYVSQRVTTNMLHYRSNYVFIAVLVLLVRIVFSPLLLITLCICGGVWYYSFIIHNQPFVVGDMEVDEQKKAIACGAVTFVLLALTGSITNLMWTFVIVVLLVGLHALFRPRSISSRTNYAYEEAKYSWLGGSTTDKKKSDAYTSDDPENPASSSSDFGESGSGAAIDNSQVRKRGSGPVGTSKYD